MGNLTQVCNSEDYKTAYSYTDLSKSAETGEVLNHYTYDAFGNTMECDEKVHNRFRYNGEQYDPLTSQYYLRARFYNPVIARFTQEDTYYGDGLNLYQYCANNPIAYVDPSGHNICQTQRDVYHDKCEAYMREHGLSDYSQIPGKEKNRMFKEMRTELGKTSDSKYKGSRTSPEIGGGVHPDGVDYSGTVYRNVAHDPATGMPYNPIEMSQYTIDTKHRYTKKGVPGLYFGDSIETVAAELGNYDVHDLNAGRTTFVFDITAKNMLDMTDSNVRKQLGVSLKNITGDLYPVTHRVGDMAYVNGYNGLIVPSARRKGGVNIVIFNPDDVTITPK